jgi:hypothetical protein
MQKKQTRASEEALSLFLKGAEILLRILHLNGCRGGRDFPEMRQRAERRGRDIAGATTAGRQKDSDGADRDGKEQTDHGGLGLAGLFFLGSVFERGNRKKKPRPFPGKRAGR